MSVLRMSAALFCVALAPLGGCQVLGSSTSPSDWVAGSSTAIAGSIEAISKSSGSPTDFTATLAYQRDVRAWAGEVAQTGSSRDEFMRGIGRIAESHGLTHWEADPATLAAIGEGLRDAGWSTEQMEQLRGELGRVQPRSVELVFEGYRRAGS